MQIWVDADACPRVIKEIIYRAADRKKVLTTLVANQPLRTPPSSYIKSMVVGSGFDVADNKIVELLDAGDLVITADIPLASDAIEKGGFALNPRGQFYTKDNIAERLAVRDMLDELRGAGVETGGPPPIGANDKQTFANKLDQFLAKY